MAKAIIKELKDIKKQYAVPRKTAIDNLAEAVVVEKAIEEKDVMFLMDRFGYAKTIDVSLYERNKDAADAENRYVFPVKNTGKICIFTDQGQMHWVRVMDLPFGKFKDKGTPIDNVSNYDSKSEHFIHVCAMESLPGTKLIFGTKTAMLKLVDGSEFVVAKKTTAATKLADGDQVLLVQTASEADTIVMRSKKDVFLRIPCDQIPEKKKGAVGVRGMRLDKDDELTDIYYLCDGDNENVEVKGKEVALNRLHIGNRDTKGVKR
jgi:DNA gyrase subunit A